MSLLELRGVKAVADGKEILHGVDMAIGEGETVVLLGANGAGKTTVAKRIMGMMRGEGEIVFRGKNLNDMEIDERARKGIFMSYQAPVEIPGVSLKEMLWTALEEKNGKAVKKMELEEKLKRAVKELEAEMFLPGREVNVGASGGERKRNEILQLLVLEPKIAILDEIDSGLDINMAKKISEILRDFQKKTGISYIIITHNMRILEKLGVKKVIIMDQGRIVEEGGVEIISKISERGFSR